ncbi:MAG: ribose 5-phosphate isomerase A [Alphaproteobacteria bacterium]|nr:ribose 5-phosphate isomerase A [Alphaproteobacteria bacterium]
MGWENTLPDYGEIKNAREKEEIAAKVASFVNDGDVIGVGSGSTAFMAIQAVAARVRGEKLNCLFVPTSRELQMACAALGLKTASILDVKPYWCFDGADEIDPAGNLLKGRGGAMFQEKLVMKACSKKYILADKTKMVSALGEKFAVPVEISQLAYRAVENELYSIGAKKVTLRSAGGKDGAVISENGHFVADVKFPSITAETEKQIKQITGVIESGLFWGYGVEVLS